jgi:hypothetical protein
MVLDIATPVVSFYLLHFLFGVAPVPALTAGAVAVGVRTVWRAVRDRAVNAFSLMMLTLLGATVLLVFITGDPRLVLAKSAVVPFVGGLYGLATQFFGRTLSYDVAQPFVTRGDPALVSGWQAAWDTDAAFVRRLRLLNILWGIGFVFSAVVRVVLIYRLPLDVAVLVAQVPTVGTVLALGLTTWRLAPPLKRAARDTTTVVDDLVPALQVAS